MSLPLVHTLDAQNRYACNMLAEMAEAMQIKDRLDSIRDGAYYGILSWAGHPLSLTVTDSEVVHIGYAMMPASYYTSNHSTMPEWNNEHEVIFRFVERSLLWSDLPIPMRRSILLDMELNGIDFNVGDIDIAKSLVCDTSVAITTALDDGKHYSIEWSKDGGVLCHVIIPVDYFLLHGTSLRESEDLLISDLKRLDCMPEDSPSDWTVTPFELHPGNDTNIFILDGDSIYISQMNNNSFFIQDDDGYKLVSSSLYPYESFSNMFVSGKIHSCYRIRLNVEMYGHKKTTVELPLINMVSYFSKKGCTPYFGLINEAEKEMKGLVLWVNPAEGYCHSASINIDKDSIDLAEGTLVGRLTPFIPISKIKKMF